MKTVKSCKTQYTPLTRRRDASASAVCIELPTVSTSLNEFADIEVASRRVGVVNALVGSHDPVFCAVLLISNHRLLRLVTSDVIMTSLLKIESVWTLE